MATFLIINLQIKRRVRLQGHVFKLLDSVQIYWLLGRKSEMPIYQMPFPQARVWIMDSESTDLVPESSLLFTCFTLRVVLRWGHVKEEDKEIMENFQVTRPSTFKTLLPLLLPCSFASWSSPLPSSPSPSTDAPSSPTRSTWLLTRTKLLNCKFSKSHKLLTLIQL